MTADTSSTTTTTTTAQHSFPAVDTANATEHDFHDDTEASISSIVEEDDTITILGEIVGASHLAREDADPQTDDDDIRAYAQVKFGNKVIHQTHPAIEKGCNPIWTISTGSLFLVTGSAQDFTHHHVHVSFWTERKDALQLTTLETCFLGKAIIPCSKIIANCNEKLLELDLYDQNSKSPSFADRGRKRGSLEMRFRFATPSDKHFLVLSQQRPELLKQLSTRDLVGKASSHVTACSALTNGIALNQQLITPLITEKDETKLAGTSFVNAISSAFTSSTYFDSASGQKRVRPKPCPDPDRINETTFMTKQEMSTATKETSKQWVQAGSGNMGKLYVEILSCKDLPNVDVGEAVGNLTDSFICAVFEDAMVQTSVIDDELSPHWLPWTQRAFVFGMLHPASLLYIGVFDFDLGLTDHEALGRVAVNISNLQRDTVYTLTYNIYKSANVTDRTPSGTITIRLRIEFENEKEVLMAALGPRPKFHVNVHKEKSFSVVHYTCFGEYGDDKEEKFDLTVLKSYVNELLEYKSILKYCLSDAFLSLIFWRGQVKVGEVLLPIHSFLFFYAGITLVERPYLAPSFFLLSVAWIMLATQTQRNQHPSPWNRCRSFADYVEVLHHGTSLLSTRPINPHEGAKEAEAFEKEWSDRIKKDLKFAATQAAMQAEISSIGNDSIQTKTFGGISLDLLEKLGRYQGMIARCCRYCRFIKIIVTWEESAVSFWIAACFLVGGLVSLLLPWAFILLWTGRTLVWGLLGPHMMIVDAVLFSDAPDEGQVLEKAMDNFKKQSRTARLRHQEAVKLKDIKSLSFGKFITFVPSHNLSRHYDRPLPGSFARLQGDKTVIEVASHCIPGQQMFGIIIPRNESAAAHHEQELAKLAGRFSRFESQVRSLEVKDDIDVLVKESRQSLDSCEGEGSAGYELINLDGQGPSDGTVGGSSHHLQIAQLSFDSKAPAQAPRRARESRRSLHVDYEVHMGDSSDERAVIPLSDSSSLAMVSEKHKLAVIQTERQARKGSILLHGFDDDRNPVNTLAKDGSSSTSREEEECGVEVILGAGSEDISVNESTDDSIIEDTDTNAEPSQCLLASPSTASASVVVYRPDEGDDTTPVELDE